MEKHDAVTARERAEELVAGMTLHEKAALCSGRGYWHTKAVKRLGLGSIMFADGPHGLRRQGRLGSAFGVGGSAPATCFPTASLTACSFDRALLCEIGEAIAEEAADQGVSVVLGPGVNIKRGPLGGRNFEYFSEDPYLSGELGAAFVRGVQSVRGVGACVKHFAGNSQETNRMVSDSVVDERTLRELYLPAFEKVIKGAKPAAVMCSYNKLNGIYASENEYLLTDILRDEWGYEGAVISDWGATADRVKGLAAGLDLEMPGSGGFNTREIVKAVRSGDLSEAVLDRAVCRVVRLALGGREAEQNAGQNAGQNVGQNAWQKISPSAPLPALYERHDALARRAAAESAVLLRNEGRVLPLQPGVKLAVIGGFAVTPRYQGAGSSRVNPTRRDCAWDELRRDFPDAAFARGYAGRGDGARAGAPDPSGLSVKERALIDEAVRVARGADAAIVFAGLPEGYESEGFDRTSLAMPASHEELIRAVCAANPHSVVVIQAGAPVDLAPADGAAAILYVWLGGQAGGGATADILTGRVNPSGKLAETFPLAAEDVPCHGNFGGESRVVNYEEGPFVGYRHYDAHGLPVAWPFGHGLSYTTFAHADRREETVGGGRKRVSVTVTNMGERAGAETLLFYDATEGGRAAREEEERADGTDGLWRRRLCGFEKVYLEPGESVTVVAELEAQAERTVPFAPHEADAGVPARFDANSTPGDIRRTPAGFVFYCVLRLALTLAMGVGGYGRRMVKSIVEETPLRAVSSMSGGLLPRPFVNALIALANLRPRRLTSQFFHD